MEKLVKNIRENLRMGFCRAISISGGGSGVLKLSWLVIILLKIFAKTCLNKENKQKGKKKLIYTIIYIFVAISACLCLNKSLLLLLFGEFFWTSGFPMCLRFSPSRSWMNFHSQISAVFPLNVLCFPLWSENCPRFAFVVAKHLFPRHWKRHGQRVLAQERRL